MTKIRKSVPTKGVHEYWLLNWAYVMPDFDKKDHSIIEWVGAGQPLEPEFNRVPNKSTQESEDVGSDNRAQ